MAPRFPAPEFDGDEELERCEYHSAGAVQFEQAEIERGEVDAVAPPLGANTSRR